MQFLNSPKLLTKQKIYIIFPFLIIIDVPMIGGSDAQIEMFYQIYLMSLIGAGHYSTAKMIMNNYLAFYHGTPLWDYWLGQYG